MNVLQKLFPRSPNPKTSFGPDQKKQGCRGTDERQIAAVIRPRGKPHTEPTLVLFSSPYRSLVLEAVHTVIAGAPRIAGSTAFGRLPHILSTLRAVAERIAHRHVQTPLLILP